MDHTMNGINFISLAASLLAPLAVLHAAEASDHLSPHQRVILESKSPQTEEYRFSFDLPAGPQFTQAEKEAQRERGKDVMPRVMKAFESGSETVRIPPGDYRFGQERWQGTKAIFPLGFENLQRDAEHPFVIDATGATFWFDPDDKQMPPGHRCVGFRNCRNIVLRGAALDRGTRGCIEGRITRIDREGNRFEIQPSPGIVVPTTFNGSAKGSVPKIQCTSFRSPSARWSDRNAEGVDRAF